MAFEDVEARHGWFLTWFCVGVFFCALLALTAVSIASLFVCFSPCEDSQNYYVHWYNTTNT